MKQKKNFFKLFLAKVQKVNRVPKGERKKLSASKALGNRKF